MFKSLALCTTLQRYLSLYLNISSFFGSTMFCTKSQEFYQFLHVFTQFGSEKFSLCMEHVSRTVSAHGISSQRNSSLTHRVPSENESTIDEIRSRSYPCFKMRDENIFSFVEMLFRPKFISTVTLSLGFWGLTQPTLVQPTDLGHRSAAEGLQAGVPRRLHPRDAV